MGGIYKLKNSLFWFKDVDECSKSEWNDCAQYSTCSNNIGLYSCQCLVGYLDISEDVVSRPGRICAGTPLNISVKNKYCHILALQYLPRAKRLFL